MESLDLSTLHLPTVIIWGEADPWLDPGLPERLQGAIASSALVRLPDVGRFVPEEVPDVLSQLLIEQLEATTRTPF